MFAKDTSDKPDAKAAATAEAALSIIAFGMKVLGDVETSDAELEAKFRSLAKYGSPTLAIERGASERLFSMPMLRTRS